MAQAKKLPSGMWRTLIYVGKNDGHRQYKSFTAPTKKESEFLASQYAITKKDEAHSFQELAIHYIHSKEQTLSPSTIRSYRYILSGACQRLHKLHLADFTSELIQNWISSLSVRYEPKTVRNIYGFASSVCKFNGYKMPYGIQLPQKKYKEFYVPTDSDVKTLLEYFKTKKDIDMVNAIQLAAYCTLRRSEVCALTAADVSENIITVNKAKVLKSKGSGYVIKETKTVSSTRKIETPGFVLETLPSKGNVVNITPTALSKRFDDAVKKLQLPHFSFHALRHYSASIMHAIGIPDEYIMKRGGWSTDSTLKRIYRGTMSDYEKNYSDKTNNYFEKIFS